MWPNDSRIWPATEMHVRAAMLTNAVAVPGLSQKGADPRSRLGSLTVIPAEILGCTSLANTNFNTSAV